MRSMLNFIIFFSNIPRFWHVAYCLFIKHCLIFFSALPVKQHTSKILRRPFMLQTVKFKVQWKQTSENDLLVAFHSESFHFGHTDLLNLDVYLFSTLQPAIIPRVCFACLVR